MTHTNDDDDHDLSGLYGESHQLHGSVWLDQAACADRSIDEYYSSYRPKIETIETCRNCPVKWNCLESVAYVESRISTTTVKHGIVGGLTSAERRRLYDKPKDTWQEEQVKQIDDYLKERYQVINLPEELRNSLYPEGL